MTLTQAIYFLAALPDCSQTIILGVKESNTNALRFYQTFGFKDTGRRKLGVQLLDTVFTSFTAEINKEDCLKSVNTLFLRHPHPHI